MKREGVGVIRCDGLGSNADDETKVATGIFAELYGYVLSILFRLSIYILEVLIGWVYTYGGQGWVLEIDPFEIYLFGCCGNF